ncbi:laminin subunit gamma-1 isoform X1 [Tribolium madens]|uniref:laminin subunit gamma-1 isoform X1 n=1 Tax=Tribolium madens TaxID=41895 RepID=UPI001CF74F9B|nr:laminin subunit gamma-1 isoform X1 [Tribolium madens]
MRCPVSLTVFVLCVFGHAGGQEADITPVIGRKGTRCYDKFNKPQRCIPEFENAAFNVLMEATNTCGDHGKTEYCVQSGVTGLRKSCEVCYTNDHQARYLTDFHNQDQPTWWQSETMFEGIQFPNQVNLTLKLGKAFDITYVRLWFYSPRPESFSIFKKTAENASWIPYQYYSASCRDTYGLPDTQHTTRGEETRALCTSEYSDISPLRGGNVAFSTLEGRPSAYNFEASPELQEWVTATDIMIVLDRLNTFGDEVFGDQQVLRSYFYAIADVAVGARCKCNGHASECITSTGVDSSRRRVCKCEHNTAGPDCNECLPFYNDAPWKRATARDAHECKQCNCNGFSNRCYYDEELYRLTGHGGHCLDCTANRDGPNCERCRENYYMREDGYCIACECNEKGSRSLQCNSEGKCQCKSGVTGDKCDRCAVNHYEFSATGCKSCGCSEAGSVNNEPNCDPYTGVCYCKENVEGRRCRECKPGFFNLDKENEFGCTPCFCYGHSSECYSARNYAKHLIDSVFSRSSERWQAEDEYGRDVEIEHVPLAHSIKAEARGDETVYFLANERFLGERRFSYNQLLQFSFWIGDYDRPIPTATDIILEGGGASVTNTIFAQQNKIPTNTKQKYSFRLHEHPNYGWQPRLSARAFMSLLDNITAIKIRATYAPQGVGFLTDVKLETAAQKVAGPPALWVEQCVCPTGYVGYFCESCKPGYRHFPSLGGRFMPCILCDCNQHAQICDSETGRCICEHNTAGDNCEFCARGYYGNALGGTPEDCKPCGCPDGGACIQVDEDIIMCTECPVGHTGHKCDSCSDGYFGDPTGRFGPKQPCTQCDCNLNIDPNGIGNCNTTTGECLKCIHNTGGPKCEVCLPGYYGNALALPKGDCQPCECNPAGTESNGGSIECDRITGSCHCKPHVIGRNCDQCEDGYFNLRSGEGCHSCNCDPIGSYNQTCNVYTGQCFCRPGINGLRCDHCEPFKYGFSSEGCKECECDKIGSRDHQCDPSGQCPCLDNVEGRRCDRCKENKYDRQRGCIDCPECYNLVQDASKEHQEKLAKLNDILDEVERRPTVIDDDEFPSELDKLQTNIDAFHEKVKKATGENSIIQQVRDIRNREKEISRTLSAIDENVYLANEKATAAEHNIENTDNLLAETEDKLNDAFEDLDVRGRKALDSAWKRAQIVGQQSDRMTQIAHEAREIADQLDADADALTQKANEAKNKSNEAYEIAKNAIRQQNNVSETERQIRSELVNTEIKLNKTKEWTQEVSDRARETKKDALALLNEVTNLIIPEIDITKLKEKAKKVKQEALQLRNDTNNIVSESNKLLVEIDEQLYRGREQLDRANIQQDDTADLLQEIYLYKSHAEAAVKMGNNILNSTKETYKILTHFDKQVQDSRAASEEALKEVDSIQEVIDDAFDKATDAELTLREAKGNADAALKRALQADELAKNASANAESIKNDADLLFQNASGLNEEADLMADRVEATQSALRTLIQETRSNDTLINQAKEKVGRAGKETEEVSKKVSDLTKNVQSILAELGNLPQIDDDELDVLEKELKEAEEKVNEAKLDEKLNELREKQKGQNDLINFYKTQIDQLQREVENVEQIAKALPEGCFKRVELEP